MGERPRTESSSSPWPGLKDRGVEADGSRSQGRFN